MEEGRGSGSLCLRAAGAGQGAALLPRSPVAGGGGTPSGPPGTAQVRPEMVEAGKGAAAQGGQKIGGAQGTGAEELFTSAKHVLGSACRKGIRAGVESRMCLFSVFLK